MVETKARNDMEAAEVLAKKEAAIKWCGHATDHANGNGGKPWRYLVVAHDLVAENMTLQGLADLSS
jgi:type III restriction enzyme